MTDLCGQFLRQFGTLVDGSPSGYEFINKFVAGKFHYERKKLSKVASKATGPAGIDSRIAPYAFFKARGRFAVNDGSSEDPISLPSTNESEIMAGM